MVEALPKWEMKKYAHLWARFGKKVFSNKDAQDTLKEKENQRMSVFFHDLSHAGWISIKRSEKDKRKKTYKLKEPNQAVKELAKNC